MKFEEWFKEANWGPVFGRVGDFHYVASVAWDYKQAEIDALQRKLKLVESLRDSQFEQLQVVTQQRDSAQVSNIELQKRIDELKAKRDGFKLVPRKPTRQIYRAFYDAFNSANAGNTAQCFKVGYKAMLSAVEEE